MASVRIIIDGHTVMDSAVTLRHGDLPTMDDLKASLQKAATGDFQPWQLPTIGALSTVLLQANTAGHIPDATITVTTRADGWNLDVAVGT